ncbi:hypothetical protein F5Y17DRAFT_430460 [Xylariaceae sp. FL0594]|nr:hypothetical protein F5Y17DRAFT_430460 [Xylariaceae sp. FL0594]
MVWLFTYMYLLIVICKTMPCSFNTGFLAIPSCRFSHSVGSLYLGGVAQLGNIICHLDYVPVSWEGQALDIYASMHRIDSIFLVLLVCVLSSHSIA